MRTFWVADLNAKGEVELQAEYRHDQLLLLDPAGVMIAEFAMLLWRSPQEFDTSIPLSRHMTLRWRASSPTSGIATVRCSGNLSSLCLLVSGQDGQSDQLTLDAVQTHLVRELHDTGIEPAFDVLDLPHRPLVASIHFEAPQEIEDRRAFALADRCFAAAYFRFLGLA